MSSIQDLLWRPVEMYILPTRNTLRCESIQATEVMIADLAMIVALMIWFRRVEHCEVRIS